MWKDSAMTRYFFNRLIRRKLCWLAFAAGCAISVCYFVKDVWRYDLYEQTVYTMWIESFTRSDIPALLYNLAPLLSALAAADIFLADKNNGYLNVVFSKSDSLRYFRSLYLVNFAAGGLTLLLPLALNLYLCFLVCPDRAPDLLAEGTNLVNSMGYDVLFPQLYYTHPLFHACIYVVLGFLAAGIFATIGLALGCYVRHRFLVWLGPYLVNYVFSALSAAAFGKSRFTLLSVYAMFYDAGDGVTPAKVTLIMGIWFMAATLLYWIGVKKNERVCI